MPADRLLFGGPRGGALSMWRWRGRVWDAWSEAAGVDLQWRLLRHYYASQLAAIGATILQCSRWMGHGSITTTMDRYAFLFDEDESAAMNRLALR
jgi:integrase